MNFIDFSKIFVGLCEMYNKEASEVFAKMWYECVKHLTVEQFNNAVFNILTSRKYTSMPLPADVLEIVNGNPDDLAMLALRELEEAMQRHGAYKSIAFKDTTIMACVEALGGWVDICRLELREWEFKKKDFLAYYKTFLRNPEKINAPKYLTGILEYTNLSNGYKIDTDLSNGYKIDTEIKLIGFKKDSVDKATFIGYFEKKQLKIENGDKDGLDRVKSLVNGLSSKL